VQSVKVRLKSASIDRSGQIILKLGKGGIQEMEKEESHATSFLLMVSIVLGAIGALVGIGGYGLHGVAGAIVLFFNTAQRKQKKRETAVFVFICGC
jgi:hypothetical protein